HGNPLMIDYTPSGADVSAGDVVMVGDYPCVAHKDIADGELGALAAGGGVYILEKDGTTGPVFSAGEDVAWDDSGELAVELAGGYHFGWSPAGAGTNDATVIAVHAPRG